MINSNVLSPLVYLAYKIEFVILLPKEFNL